MRKKISLIVLLLASSACILHKPYTRPKMDIPPAWRLSENESGTLSNVKWWEQFDDPVLSDLIAEALQDNLDLRVAIARVYEFLEQFKIVRSQLLPQISGEASEMRQEQSLALLPGPLVGKRTFNTYAIGINLAFEIDIWGRIFSETEAAWAIYCETIEARKTVILTLVSSVASSYIQLCLYDLQLAIAIKTQKSREESFQLAEERYRGGLTSEMEVKQAESVVDSAIADVIRFEVLQQQTENLLCLLLGRVPGPIERGRTLNQLKLPFDVPTGLPSDLLENRPDILQAEELLIAANANIGQAVAQAFPSLSLTGNYGNASLELHNLLTGFARAWLFGSSLFQSIYSGGRITAQIKEADAQFLEALYSYEQTVLQAFKEVNDALIAHQKAKELQEVLKHQVTVLSRYLALAHLQYDNGQTDYLNVLDAERNLFAAELDYADSSANTFLSLINLYKALGGGWVIAEDLGVISNKGECYDVF